MLMIRKDHYDTLLQGDPDRFVEHVVRHVVEDMPEEVRGVPLHLLWDMIETAIRRAKRHGLTTDGQIIGFVSVMFEIAPNFDQEPTLHGILADTRRSPGDRWEALFADEPRLNAAWERAAAPGFYDESAWIAPPASPGRER